ncbi:hypothetical protein Droror1_Dr00002215 [Drosera rotundifolia]
MAPYNSTQTRFDEILGQIKKSGLGFLLSITCNISYTQANEFLDNGLILKDLNEEEFMTNVVGEDITVDTTSIKKVFRLPEGEDKAISDKLPTHYGYLASIVQKCLLCKTTSADQISRLNLKIVATIIVEAKIDWAYVVLNLWRDYIAEAKSNPQKKSYIRLVAYYLKKMGKLHGDTWIESPPPHQVHIPQTFEV